MNTKQKSYLATIAFTMSVLAMSSLGCSADPDGNPGAGGAGGNAGGSGGASGSALGAIKGMAVATFNTDIEMFKMNDYSDPNSMNLFGGMAAVPMHSATEGSPAAPPGALTLTAPYTDYMQYVEFMKDFGETTLQNWTGRTKLYVRVKIASGGNADLMSPAGVIVFVQSFTGGTFVYSGGVYTNVAPGNGWQEFSWTAPVGFDLAAIRLMGVQITTGQGSLTAAKPTAATIYVDSFSIE